MEQLKSFEEHIAPWLNRVLLGFLVWFALQVYEKLDTISIQQQDLMRTQSVQQELIRQNQASIIKLYEEDARFRSSLEGFYRDYGWALEKARSENK